MQLFDEENTEGIEYLLTNRINQDVLENLFSIYRLKGGNNKNPSARLLRSVFRSYLTEMLVRLPGHQNCEAEIDSLTCDLPDKVRKPDNDPEEWQTSAPQPASPQPTSSHPPKEGNLEESSSCVNVAVASSNVPAEGAPSLEQCSVTYFAGWLAKKCNDKFKCIKCLQVMTVNTDLDDKKQLLILEKTYGNAENTKLKCPSETFYQVIDVCLTNYELQFDIVKHKLNVKKIFWKI